MDYQHCCLTRVCFRIGPKKHKNVENNEVLNKFRLATAVLHNIDVSNVQNVKNSSDKTKRDYVAR